MTSYANRGLEDLMKSMEEIAAPKSRSRAISFSVEDKLLSSGKQHRQQESGPGRHKTKTRPAETEEKEAITPINKKDLIDLNFSEKFPSKLHKNYVGKSVRSLNVRCSKVVDVTVQAIKNRNYMHISCSTHLTIEMNLSHLVELDLSQNRLHNFLSEDVVTLLPSMKRLYMNDNKIKMLPPASLRKLSEYGALEELNLGTNTLEQLPPEIGLLTSLRKLKLSHNKLVELPKEIVNLNYLYNSVQALNIAGNNLIVPQQLIAELGGLSFIKCHFNLKSAETSLLPSDRYLHNLLVQHVTPVHSKDLKNRGKGGSGAVAGKTHSLQMKLLVVGHERAGKTSLIGKLKGNASHCKNDGASGSAQKEKGAATTEDAASLAEPLTPNCHTPLSASKEGLKPFALKAPVPLSYGTAGVTSPGSEGSSRPSTPSTSHTPSVYDLDHESTVGFEISRWNPKKSNLNNFLLPKSADVMNKADKTAKTLFVARPEDIRYIIWDFAGQGVYHAVHEMFFSTFALHLLVFDISKTRTEHDCDVYVQYWIDLIQARAPGSSIVIAATHADKLSSEETNQRIAMVQARIASNEALRLADLRRDIDYCNDAEKQSTFRSLLIKRPKIDKEIIALRKSTVETDFRDIMYLTCRIAQLATPTHEVPHPFDIINIEVPEYFQQVKETMTELRKDQSKKFCTIKELEEIIIAKANKANNVAKADIGVAGGKHKNLLKETTMAVMHWSNVGEVLWFNIKNGGNPLLQAAAAIHSSREPPSMSRASTDSNVSGDASQHASDYVFLDPDWLVNCIKLILSHKLVGEISTYEKLLLTDDAESRRVKHNFFVKKLAAKRGIISWDFIKTYLGDKYEQVIEVIRTVLVNFNVIIPIRSEEPPQLKRAQSEIIKSFSTSTAFEDSLQSPVGITPTSGATPHGRSLSSTHPSMLTLSLAATAAPVEEQYYLIPSLLPAYNNEASTIQSGFITLERTFHFNRFTPPGLIQTIFSRIYQFQTDRVRPLSSSESTAQNVCWDRAFTQEYKTVRILVQLMANNDTFSLKRPASRSNMSPTGEAPLEPGEVNHQDFSSQLRIRGVGHVLNSHLILDQLDKYTEATRQVLEDYPGLGHVRLSSTCPDCLIYQSDDANRGEFRHSELMSLQETFKKVSQSLEHVRQGNVTAKMRSELRQWNSKRHTCPRNRCQIKSDMLIFIPKPLKAEIEQTSKSEKEINFLLDEVVRVSSVPSKVISNCVVKVMSANGLCFIVDDLMSHLKAPDNPDSPYFGVQSTILSVSPLNYSSGVVVTPPPVPGFDEGADAVPDKCPSPLVLACEHVMTDMKQVDGKYQFTRIGAGEEMETVFFIGNATHWLYLAEVIYQGSTYPGSETNFWDMCALRILAPIKPLLQRQQMMKGESLDAEILLDSPVTTPSRSNTPLNRIITFPAEPEVPILLHPYCSSPPLRAIKVSTKKVAVDQVVRLLGFPGRWDLAVDWGRVEQNDPNGDILINLLSDDGSSGGPVVDRDGHLIGLLSRSHDFIKYSCVQHLRNLFDIIRNLDL